MHYKSHADLYAFQDRLLAGTLRNAHKTSFYNALWNGIDLKKIELASIDRLPIVNSVALKAAGPGAQLRHRMICDEVTTSGTTDRSFVTVRSRREQQFVHRFFRSFLRGRASTPLPRAIEFTNPYHGHHLYLDVPIFVHKMSLYDRGSFERALNIIVSENRDKSVMPRCTLLFGLERHIVAFGMFVKGRHPEGLSSSLQDITVYGHYLTDKTRTFLESTFLCRISDQFGLSEVFGSARQADNGWYFYDPTTIAEVVNPFTGQRITEGIGSLVVTALYPFQQAQPIVRYDTADLVLVTHKSEGRPGRLGFKPLGRRRYAIESSEAEGYVLLPNDVYEVLDDCDGICRTPLFLDSSQVVAPSAVGYPRYRIRASEKSSKPLRIVLEVEFEEHLNDVKKNAFKKAIADRLLLRSPQLNAQVTSGAAHLEIKECSNFSPDQISYAE